MLKKKNCFFFLLTWKSIFELFLSVMDTMATDILTLKKNAVNRHKNNIPAWMYLFPKVPPEKYEKKNYVDMRQK